MDPVHLFLVSGVLPGVVSAAVLLLWGRSLGVLPVLAAGFVAGCLANEGVPVFPPREAWQCLLPMALAASLLGGLEAFLKLPRRACWTLRILLVLALLWTTLQDRTALLLAGIGGGILLHLWFIERLSARGGSSAFLLASGITTLGCTLALAFSGSLRLAQLGGGLVAAAAVCLALGRWIPLAGSGAVPLAGILPAGLALNGMVYAEMPAASVILLGAAPLAWVLVDGLAALRLKPRPLAVARLAASVLMTGAAVAVAVLKSPPLDV